MHTTHTYIDNTTFSLSYRPSVERDYDGVRDAVHVAAEVHDVLVLELSRLLLEIRATRNAGVRAVKKHNVLIENTIRSYSTQPTYIKHNVLI